MRKRTKKKLGIVKGGGGVNNEMRNRIEYRYRYALWNPGLEINL